MTILSAATSQNLTAIVETNNSCNSEPNIINLRQFCESFSGLHITLSACFSAAAALTCVLLVPAPLSVAPSLTATTHEQTCKEEISSNGNND